MLKMLNSLLNAAAILAVVAIATQGQTPPRAEIPARSTADPPPDPAPVVNPRQAPAEEKPYIRDPAPKIQIIESRCTLSRARAIEYWRSDVQSIKSMSEVCQDGQCLRNSFGNAYEPLVKSLSEGSYLMDPPEAYVRVIEHRLATVGRGTFHAPDERGSRR